MNDVVNSSLQFYDGEALNDDERRSLVIDTLSRCSERGQTLLLWAQADDRNASSSIKWRLRSVPRGEQCEFEAPNGDNSTRVHGVLLLPIGDKRDWGGRRASELQL